MAGYLKTRKVIEGLPHNLITNNKYIVRFAQTQEELQDAQRLRFEVFNLELGEGLQSSFDRELDVDPYDEQCHHLMVLERRSRKAIGTYRMQTYDMANNARGFYTDREFEISSLSLEVLEQSVEVGRACIEKDHRNGRVLFLLWRGLAKYVAFTRSRYLFGCCSLTSQDEKEAWIVMDYLQNNQLVHDRLRADTKPEFRCDPVEIDPEAWKEVRLPQLFRLYMDVGARVCSPPAIDRAFKTIDYLVILDVKELDERTRMLFFN